MAGCPTHYEFFRHCNVFAKIAPLLIDMHRVFKFTLSLEGEGEMLTFINAGHERERPHPNPPRRESEQLKDPGVPHRAIAL